MQVLLFFAPGCSAADTCCLLLHRLQWLLLLSLCQHSSVYVPAAAYAYATSTELKNRFSVLQLTSHSCSVFVKATVCGLASCRKPIAKLHSYSCSFINTTSRQQRRKQHM
jgi:hypothetical protein